MPSVIRCIVSGLCSLASVLAISTIEVKGSKFYTSDQQQFFVKGIAYQLSPADPLLDADICEKNFALMAQAGTNVIRTYHVDPWQNHDACMSILEKYGIYLILNVDTFNTTITQDDPTWNYYQMRSYEHVVAAFAKYDNLLGFFAGNEIVNTATGTAASPYIKASVRDTKNFIRNMGYRAIPVGYSAADIAEIRPTFQNYLVCADGASNDDVSAIDFWGLNTYEWCGTSTYQQSGYQTLTEQVLDYPKPVFFSEFGCNAVQPRQFQDIPALYGPNMSSVWSGGIVYEWLQEANDYGLVNIDTAGNPTPLADYNVLSSQWAQASPMSTAYSAYTPTNTAPACPTNSSAFSVAGTALPATPTDDGTADWEPQQILANANADTLATSTLGNTMSTSTAANKATKTSTHTTAHVTTTSTHQSITNIHQSTNAAQTSTSSTVNSAASTSAALSTSQTTNNAASSVGALHMWSLYLGFSTLLFVL